MVSKEIVLTKETTGSETRRRGQFAPEIQKKWTVDSRNTMKRTVGSRNIMKETVGFRNMMKRSWFPKYSFCPTSVKNMSLAMNIQMRYCCHIGLHMAFPCGSFDQHLRVNLGQKMGCIILLTNIGLDRTQVVATSGMILICPRNGFIVSTGNFLRFQEN